MFRSERAKQFLPFDALRGLREELKKREEKFLEQDKKELTEEEIKALSDELQKATKGAEVSLTFYLRRRYVFLNGIITSINFVYKYLTVGEMKIFFDDIKEMKIND